ncbi:MAG TPA: energy-coupling factor transporter ATPase [Syntrophales bacterium]|jgi:biotin transport system ATP-binding protein/energy-coupling factor transport system ATP-binding protein|nr:energy-coupling factor transporter ATPase [Syntrophales bacterium]HOX93493.1 energy-coupling factor transporter ATPase [Syntrophales bacterium]HPI57537.1 energy-coupling factor transporter ATPase [Syntrophales bacterium]HPN24694.1 energy-coupling factor transporter ATPase [Syntrophales bacterium]HQM29825.1 energy-coupling factor transporter ATPase [Syntrophales bacterium]
MIRIENLEFRYTAEGPPVLFSVDAQIGDGQYVALIGPNGCGKTTLAKHLNGLLSPTSGDVWVDGMNTKDSSALRDLRRTVGMVFQNPDNQIVGMTVEEDLAFGPGNLRLAAAEIGRRVEESLHAVGLSGYEKRPTHTLSGGEKRLIAIAGVLAMQPRHLVFDEPTSFLDPAGKRRVLNVIRKLNGSGITVIHVTHDMDEIVESDRVLVMTGGRISMTGSPGEVLSRVEEMKAMGLGPPQVTELMWRLRQSGQDVRQNVVTIDEAVSALTSLILEKSLSDGDHARPEV